MFKDDISVKEEVCRIRIQELGGNPESAAKVTARLFEDARSKPGGLERLEYIAERDLERYAEEYKYFKVVTQRSFDIEHMSLQNQKSPHR